MQDNSCSSRSRGSPLAHFGEDGLVPKLLARVHVGHMHLDDGDFDPRDGVADGVGIVRERARIQNDAVIHALRLPDLRAELPFYVTLKEVRLMPVRLHEVRNAFIDALQRIRAVHALFAHARAPEIDAVQNQKLHILSPSLRCPMRPYRHSCDARAARECCRAARSVCLCF